MRKILAAILVLMLIPTMVFAIGSGKPPCYANADKKCQGLYGSAWGAPNGYNFVNWVNYSNVNPIGPKFLADGTPDYVKDGNGNFIPNATGWRSVRNGIQFCGDTPAGIAPAGQWADCYVPTLPTYNPVKYKECTAAEYAKC